MDKNKIILAAIAILVIALIALGAYIIISNGDQASVNGNVTLQNKTDDNNTTVIMIDENGNVTNDTDIGNNSANNTNDTNKTYRIYDPQSDSYVTVIGEAYDAEVDRWYTYDTDGVRYYNTRIKNF
ncbi:hypothetical protein [Methanobrevibacter sp.]|uniref:hypothetical protein n=1 Tax=Methanobrevibacter sp. TaxID=66852 RepID=UPI0025E4DDC9|nr:hypothetical protein [Methanobrevibacter sp.]MBR4448499.1 hypothetical protein [Methanobrevibacter sp.]